MAKEIKNNLYVSFPRKRESMTMASRMVAILILVLGFAMPAFATYTPPVGNNNDVQYKNGFGFAGSDNFVVNGTNIGIGSMHPGQVLDVNGTVRSISGGFIFPDGSMQSSAATGGNSWTMSSGNVYTTTGSNNVGIGTSTPVGGLSVMNGNVGIGTWVPATALDVQGAATIKLPGGNTGTVLTIGNASLGLFGTLGFSSVSGNPLQVFGGSGDDLSLGANNAEVLHISGMNVGIGTNITSNAGLSIMNGNVGIGTWVPNNTLEVNAAQNTIPLSIMATQFATNNYTGLGFGSSASGALSTKAAILFSDSNPNYNSWNRGDFVFAVNNGANANSAGISDERMRITADGNVGIGSTVPGQRIDVQGTVRATNFVGNGSGLTGLSSGLWNTTNTNDVYEQNGSTFGNVGIGTTITNAGAALSVMNGNVGIGTWVPGSLLTVAGTSTFTGIEKITNNTTTSSTSTGALVVSGGVGIGGGIIAGDSITVEGGGLTLTTSGSGGIITGNSSGFLFSPNSVQKAILTDSGNLGIGTVVPGAELDIEGTLYPTVFYGRGTDQNVGIGSIAPGQALDVVGTVRATNFVGNGSGLTGLSSGLWATQNTTDQSLAGGNVGIGTTKTTTAALTVMNGNVGIGTWVPNAPLTVIGNVGSEVNQVNYNFAAPNALINYRADGSQSSPTALQAGDNIFNFNARGYNGTSYTTAASAAMTFFAAENWTSSANGGYITFNTVPIGSVPPSTERMRISDAGNVGIGTSTPAGGLVVMNGNVGIGTWVPLNPFQVNTPSSQNFYITPTGNVGIGAGPDQNLTVSSGSTTRMDVISGSTFMSFGADPTNGPFYLYNSSQSLRFASASLTDGTGFAERMRIDTQGNVGIGTTIPVGGLAVMNGNVGIGTWVPGSTVDVKGTLNVSSTGAFGNNVTVTGTINCNSSASCTIQNPSTSATPSTLVIKGGANAGSNLTLESTSKTGNGDYIDFEEGNVGVGTVDVMRMVNGNVGIGTWVPMATLDINGSLQLEGSGNTYFTGNVGISSTSPGKALDVNGAARMTGFTLTTSPTNGYVLTSDTNGNGTWQAAGGSSQWTTTNTNDVYETAGGNVGIGTTKTTTAALTVMNGNVGIGTWVPTSTLQANGTINLAADSSDFLTITTNGVNLYSNTGSGKQVTLAGIAFVASAGMFVDGSTHVDNTGIIGWTAGSDATASADTALARNAAGVVEVDNGTAGTFASLIASNIGIGTTKTTTSALTVMNGNVGIGTWVPGAALQVAGSILSSSTSGIGYTKGAGSTVTQSTSKSTGVTINAATGTITMNGAALVAATIVTFTVTDSTVAATDCIFTQHDSGGTIGAYTITANSPAAGSFNISVRNNTAGSLSEAIVIRFAVIKAVTS